MLSKRILLVEDNRDDEELTLIALRKGKVLNKIDVVRDGAEALDFIFARGKYADRVLPQIVLLDLKLPKVEGIEVLRQIRANEATKLLPVIILTSSREERDLIDGYTTGANSYVVKPVDTAQFMESVQQLGLYWLVVNEAVAKMKNE
jgi:CheY-like chemotaxis protein